MPLQRDCEIPPSDTTHSRSHATFAARFGRCTSYVRYKRGKRIRLPAPADRQVVFLEESSIQTLDTCTGPPGRQGHKGKGRAGERACQGEQVRAANHRDSGQYLVGRGGGGLLYTLLGNISRSHWYRSPW